MAVEQPTTFERLNDGVEIYRNGLGDGVQIDVYAQPPIVPGERLAEVVRGSDRIQVAGRTTLMLSTISSSPPNSNVVRVEVFHKGSVDNTATASRVATDAYVRLREYHAAMDDPWQLGQLIEQFKQDPLW